MADHTLSLQTDLSTASPLHAAISRWAADVEAMSGGRLEIDVHASGAIVPGSQVLMAVGDGVLDLGFGLVNPLVDFPEVAIFQAPFAIAPGTAASAAAWSMFEDGSLDIAGLNEIAVHIGSAAGLHLREDLRRPDQMDGLRIAGAAMSPLVAAYLESLGAFPVALPLAEMYPAMQVGVIDGVAQRWDFGPLELRLPEVAATELVYEGGVGLSTSLHVLAISEGVRAELPSDLLELVEDASGDLLALALGTAGVEAATVNIAAAEDLYGTIVRLDAAETEVWRQSAQAVIDTFFADLAAEGIDAAALHAEFVSRIGEADSEPTSGDDLLVGGPGVDFLDGLAGDDRLFGAGDVDTLVGGEGNDLLDGGPGADFMLGGPGDDIYHVDDTYDLIDEGYVFPAYGFGGTDRVVSSAAWFWDVYGIGEVLVADPATEGGSSTIVGGVFDNEIIGHDGQNILFGRGGSDTYRAGDGVDYISLSLLGVPGDLYDGVDGENLIVVDPRSAGSASWDIVYEFEPGKDRVDVSAYGYTMSELMARGHAIGGDSYFLLNDGLDYLYFVGVDLAALSEADFIV